MPFTHTPTTMMPDNNGAWYSRSECQHLMKENADLKKANALLTKELRVIARSLKELRGMMTPAPTTPTPAQGGPS